jgi:hypothetical protein
MTPQHRDKFNMTGNSSVPQREDIHCGSGGAFGCRRARVEPLWREIAYAVACRVKVEGEVRGIRLEQQDQNIAVT